MPAIKSLRKTSGAHFATIETATTLAESMSLAATNALGKQLEAVLTGHRLVLTQLLARIESLEARTLRGRYHRTIARLQGWVQRQRRPTKPPTTDLDSGSSA